MRVGVPNMTFSIYTLRRKGCRILSVISFIMEATMAEYGYSIFRR
jgi:hypothetical protein